MARRAGRQIGRMNKDHPGEASDIRIALRAREAAKALGISPRLLATLVAERRVPHVRVNKALIFPVRELQDWLTGETAKGGKP